MTQRTNPLLVSAFIALQSFNWLTDLTFNEIYVAFPLVLIDFSDNQFTCI